MLLTLPLIHDLVMSFGVFFIDSAATHQIRKLSDLLVPYCPLNLSTQTILEFDALREFSSLSIIVRIKLDQLNKLAAYSVTDISSCFSSRNSISFFPRTSFLRHCSSNSSIIPPSHSLFITQRTIIRKLDDNIQPSHNTNDSTTWPDGPTCSDTNCNTPFSQHINNI